MNEKINLEYNKTGNKGLVHWIYGFIFIALTILLTVRGITLAGKYHKESMEQAVRRSQEVQQKMEHIGLSPRVKEDSDGIEFNLEYCDSEKYEYVHSYYQDITPLIQQNLLPNTSINYSEEFTLYGTDIEHGSISIDYKEISKDDAERFYKLLEHLNDIYCGEVIQESELKKLIQEYMDKQRDRHISFDVDQYEVHYRLFYYETNKHFKFDISIDRIITAP